MFEQSELCLTNFDEIGSADSRESYDIRSTLGCRYGAHLRPNRPDEEKSTLLAVQHVTVREKRGVLFVMPSLFELLGEIAQFRRGGAKANVQQSRRTPLLDHELVVLILAAAHTSLTLRYILHVFRRLAQG